MSADTKNVTASIANGAVNAWMTLAFANARSPTRAIIRLCPPFPSTRGTFGLKITMTDSLHADFSHLDCKADFWSLRVVDERAENYCVRKNVPQPPSMSLDRGAMLTVYASRGYGYAPTSDLSRAGLQAALDRAAGWALTSAPRSLIDSRTLPRPALRGD